MLNLHFLKQIQCTFKLECLDLSEKRFKKCYVYFNIYTIYMGCKWSSLCIIIYINYRIRNALISPEDSIFTDFKWLIALENYFMHYKIVLWTFHFGSSLSYRSSNFSIANVIAVSLFALFLYLFMASFLSLYL